MKTRLALLLLPLALAACGDGKPKEQPVVEEVAFRALEGVAAERVKLELDQTTQGYVMGLTRQLGRTLEVQVADIHLSPANTPDRAVLLLGGTPCTPQSCFLAITHKAPNASEQVLNIFPFNPETEKIYLTYALSQDGLRDMLVTSGNESQRFRYQVNLVNVDDGEAGSYMPVGREAFPPPAAEDARP